MDKKQGVGDGKKDVYEECEYLGLSGEELGLRGGGVRGTAGLGAMVAAGIKPWAMFFYKSHKEAQLHVWERIVNDM